MTIVEDYPEPQKLPDPPIEGSFWSANEINWKQEPPYDPSPPWGVDEEEIRATETGGKLKISYIITSSADISGTYQWSIYRNMHTKRCWFEAPDGNTFEIAKNQRDIAKTIRRGELWVELWNQTGGVEMVDGKYVIPVDVAVIGKPAIAAYLYSVQGEYIRNIAEKMEVERDTCRKYLTRFDRGERIVIPEYMHWI